MDFLSYEAKKLQIIYKSLGIIEPFTWLNGRSFSDSFVICLGAGPWKFDRRKKIQQMAINTLNGRDLSEIEIENGLDYNPKYDVINWFPLDWQNKYLYNMVNYLQTYRLTMNEYCNNLIDGSPISNYDPHIREFLYQACGKPNGIKVLSLFCRDALKIPSFPIDRHVRKYLKQEKFPTNERDMVSLCLEANLDPNFVATGIIKNIAKIDNPDWSIK